MARERSPRGNGAHTDGDDPTAVELDGVTRTYGDTHALRDVSLSVHEGEFFTLVGPSGCGKTTTLRLIAGFESPTEGTIRIGGTDVTGVPPESRDIGVVFQNYALFPHMTVGENVGYGLRFADPPDGNSSDDRVAELLELVDLPGMQGRTPESLSGGQQQRVAIARALAPGPELLLLDEPMSALDARLRERLRLQVKRIQTELGITTVYVTHDQEEALSISDRMAVMNDGRVEQVGEPRKVYRRPATRFVAEFVGDNNVFTGEIVGVDPGDENADAEQLIVDVDGTQFSIATDGRQAVGSAATGSQAVFCVRPEAMVPDAAENRFDARVTGTEFLGETTRIHLEWQGRELLLRTAEPLDGEVTFGFEPDGAHLVEIR
ncbi:thiamine transport system ATP-binding protein [Halalkaliarchaeum desulfuricum]|uniref:Molybdate/tungstate import ATP-binding protein WtpC n=1 Tax=Halalkaliarchaeum desulfuricum TaxID=2055893 RepID=A0A343TK14_9EURY|nr:ABC transporter ATP-binding protein [Halalkaliarchaeum desulfuricum]AUX09436.1 thiamine transport system ATP-binding protein [Halalkaliarchaeum desulfuricum]